jgi:phage shock protein PspC (stress-responsive transcriptional regulator)
METTQSTQQQQPQHTPQPRLERLRSDRVLGGVASGMARHLGIETAWVRIAFVVAALFGGAGILAYLIGWIAIPEEGESESMLVTQTRSNTRLGSWVGIGLIALAAIILIGNTGLIDGEILFAGGLIVLGILLYRGDLGDFGRSPQRDDEKSEPAFPAAPLEASEPPASTPASTPAYGFDETPYVSLPTPPPVVAPPPAAAFQPRPPKPRQPSVLGRLTLATLLIAVGVMGVGQSAGWWDPYPRHYAGAIIATLGFALVIGAFVGRARWLIALGLMTTPLLFGAALLDVPLVGGFGNPHYTPTSGAELSSEYRLVGGEMILDLSALDLAPGETYQIDTSIAFGTLEIRVPEGLGVNIEAQVDAGQISRNGVPVDDGINLDSIQTLAGDGAIELDAHVGFGEITIYEVEE